MMWVMLNLLRISLLVAAVISEINKLSSTTVLIQALLIHDATDHIHVKYIRMTSQNTAHTSSQHITSQEAKHHSTCGTWKFDTDINGVGNMQYHSVCEASFLTRRAFPAASYCLKKPWYQVTVSQSVYLLEISNYQLTIDEIMVDLDILVLMSLCWHVQQRKPASDCWWWTIQQRNVRRPF